MIMLLILLGGLGFFVWHDLLETRGRCSKMRVQTKLVLVMTAILFLGGTVGFLLLEYNGNAYREMGASDKLLASMFQSVTMRTAGFNTVDLAAFSEGSILLMICLMLIGGSTGSTAGGMKMTTAAVLVLSVISTFKHRKNIECFGRRLEEDIARAASCIFMMYLVLVLSATIIISAIESLPVLPVLFETVSAAATVGLTLGITPELSMVSKLILAALMIFGRAGSMTMLLAFSSDRAPVASKLPLEKIQIG